MPEERFDIIFSGQLIQGQDSAAVRERLRRLFKSSDAHIEQLFCGKPVMIKKHVDIDTAGKYRLAFRQAGALVEIRPSADASRQSTGPGIAADTAEMTLLPPNTGSLEEFAPSVRPIPLPDVSRLSMSAPGTALDESPAPPPVRIDTHGLSMVEGRDWTLEDCQPLPLPEVTLDISDLELVAPDDDSHIPPEPPPLPLPDISGLSLGEPDEKD